MMKHFIFAGLALFSGLVQAEELGSKTIKTKICFEASDILSDDYRFNQFDQKKCEAGNFEVTEKLYDQTTSELTVLKIKFEFSQKELEVAGKAVAVRTFNVDGNGQITKSWSVRSTNLNAADDRSYASIINQMFDEDFNFGNGDGGVSQVSSSMTLVEVVKDIEQDLPNDEDADGCKYVTTSETKYAINDLSYQADDLGEYIKKLNKQGKVKAVVSRMYDEGGSEYCSNFYFRILLEDGTYIYLDLDFTT